MSTIKPIAARHCADFLGDQLIITIPSRKHWTQIPFMCVWLLFWAFFLISSSTSFLLDAPGFDPFFSLWTFIWLIGGIYPLSALAWQLAGVELVEISSYSLNIRWQIFGLGWTKAYVAGDVRDLRVSPRPLVRYGRGNHLQSFWNLDGPITFDYGAKTVRFGDGVDEAEAKQIVKLIQQQFPQYK
jgi:hypothetical protein